MDLVELSLYRLAGTVTQYAQDPVAITFHQWSGLDPRVWIHGFGASTTVTDVTRACFPNSHSMTCTLLQTKKFTAARGHHGHIDISKKLLEAGCVLTGGS